MADLSVKKVIKVAKAELGYKETPVNITKFAADFDKIYPDFYNTRKQGAEWCDIFVDWCFVQAYGEKDALKLLCQPKKSAGAGCKYSYQYFKAKKQTGKTPKVGAQIFFGSKEPTHTGLVIEVSKTSVTTIEGNKDNSVKKCVYPIDSSKIFGYGYPKYTEASNSAQNEPVSASKPQKGTTYTVKKGDTLWSISERMLGSGSRYKEIMEWNNLSSILIKPGQKLILH